MKITYTLSRQDTISLNKVVCRRLAAAANATKSRWGQLALNVLAWVAIAYTSAAYVSLYKGYPRLTSDLGEVLVAFGIAIVMLSAGWLHRQKLYRDAMFSDASWSRGTQAMSASPEGLDFATSGASAQYSWSRFEDFAEDEQLLFLFLDVANAVVIPKRAFGTPEELAQFRSWVESSDKSPQA